MEREKRKSQGLSTSVRIRRVCATKGKNAAPSTRITKETEVRQRFGMKGKDGGWNQEMDC